jgi:hypothetical protein
VSGVLAALVCQFVIKLNKYSKNEIHVVVVEVRFILYSIQCVLCSFCYKSHDLAALICQFVINCTSILKNKIHAVGALRFIYSIQWCSFGYKIQPRPFMQILA